MLPASEHDLELTSNDYALLRAVIHRLVQLRRAASPLVQLQFQIHVLGALAAVVVGKSAAFDCWVFAHVDAPGIVGVAGEKAGGADLD
jgi:hypothetical protein